MLYLALEINILDDFYQEKAPKILALDIKMQLESSEYLEFICPWDLQKMLKNRPEQIGEMFLDFDDTVFSC